MQLDNLIKTKKDYVLSVRIYEEFKTVTDKISVIGTLLDNNKIFSDEKNKELQKKLTLSLSLAKDIEDILSKMEVERIADLLKEFQNTFKNPNV
jgi:predicted transcriptional regulator